MEEEQFDILEHESVTIQEDNCHHLHLVWMAALLHAKETIDATIVNAAGLRLADCFFEQTKLQAHQISEIE
jgi:hypothetical protein